MSDAVVEDATRDRIVLALTVLGSLALIGMGAGYVESGAFAALGPAVTDVLGGF